MFDEYYIITSSKYIGEHNITTPLHVKIRRDKNY